MDGLKPGRGNHAGRPHGRPAARVATPGLEHHRHSGEKYWLVRSLGKVAADYKETLWNRFCKTSFAQWPDESLRNRVYAFTIAGLLVFSIIAAVLQPFMDKASYKLTETSRSVIPVPNKHLGTLLKLKDKEQKFAYNENYKPAPVTATTFKTGNGDPRITASLAKDPKKGIVVTDPVNTVDVTMKPKFSLGLGKQDENQIVYPLNKADGYLVYTAQIASVKEDILLQSAGKDKMTFEYELSLPDGTEARLESNGSIGVYGSSLPLYGNVATGSDKDVNLLKKAKDNAKKDKFLFGIPAPVIKEKGSTHSLVHAYYQLDGQKLTLVAENLKQASYPLAIDPSIYIQSAAQLMYGNNESNVDFDVATEQFKKGFTTGARINSWADTTDMSGGSVWDQGVAASAGYVYRAGGRTSRIMPELIDQKTTTMSTASTSFAMSMPTTRPAGDLYVAIIAHASTVTVSPPDGNWIEYADTREHAAYYRVGQNVSGGNEAATYTFTLSGSQAAAGVILRLRDVDTSDPVSGTAGTGSNGTATDPVYPATTPDTQGTLMIRAAGFAGTNVPATSSFSPANHEDVVSGHSSGSSSATQAGFVVSTPNNPTLSGVSSGTATVDLTSNVTYGASSIAFNGTNVTTALKSTVEWAHFNSSTGAIESTAPGSNAVACSGWCTDTAYDLPLDPSVTNIGAGRVGMTMTAYNGYLYVMGGYDGTQLKSTVYIAKLGANGEPSKWHPSDSNQANWVYWYKDTGLNGAAVRAYHSAYAYNGKMYIVGGDSNTTANSGSMTTVEVASILPNGTLGSWSATTSLGSGRYGAAVQVYNGYMYVLGGNNNGTMITGSTASTSNAIFTKINSDGTLNSWQLAAADGSSTTFNTPRSSHGGQMSGIWGGYLYLSGGCSAVNASGYCTATARDVQLASINADGTLDVWNTMNNLYNKRYGYSFVAWQNSLYRVGGCQFQDPSTGECYGAYKRVQYGNINQDGDASTVSISTEPGTTNCVDPDPYDCSISTSEGQMFMSVAILNGFIYVIGGCTTYQCTTMTADTSYAAIDSNGRLKSPPTCSGTTNGAWCIDSTNTLNTAVGGAAVTVFGGYIYVIGGTTNYSALSNDLSRVQPNADGSLPGAWSHQNIAGVFLNNTNLGFSQFAFGYAYARANPSAASTVPGNLFLFGGCTTLGTGGSAGSCTAYTANVYKCRILSSSAIDDSTGTACTTSGQQGIGTVTGASGAGLGAHSGAVYANYIYLIGGSAPGTSDLSVVRYAKFDNSNNVVAVSGGAWIEDGSTTTYARSRGAAFGYNGYLYVVGGYNSGGSGVLRDIQFAKINVSDGSISDFSTSIVTINQRWGLGLIVSNSYAYVIGGCTNGTAPACTNAASLTDTVQTFQVYNNDSGAPANYTSPTGGGLYDVSSSTDRVGASTAVYNGYIYIAGGCTGSTECASTTGNVQKGTIDASGAITSWTATGVGAFPSSATRGFGQLEIAGGTLYYLGGQTGSNLNTAQSTIYYATPNGSGDITWSTATKAIGDTGSGGQTRTQFSSAVWNNRIYVIGGYNSSSAVQSTVYISPQLNSGGDIASNWTSSTAISVARSGHVTIAYANNLYVLGGYDGTNYLSDVQFASLGYKTGTISQSGTTVTGSGTTFTSSQVGSTIQYIDDGSTATITGFTNGTTITVSASKTYSGGTGKYVIQDGSVGSWTYTTNMPSPVRQADGFAANGYMYIFGGRSSLNDCAARTLIAPISANTTILTGNNPTGVGEWYQTNRNFDGGRYGVAAANYQGKAYLLGGGCQGIVMQDDFDSDYTPGEWSSTTGFAANTNCQSNSTSNTFSTNTGGNYAATKAVDVSSGGTVYFKLYIPLADIGTSCYKGEGALLDLNPDHVSLQYCSGACGSWTTIGATYNFAQQDPMKPYVVTLPAGAQTTTTKLRWLMVNGEATDSFALEDVYIVAAGSNTMAYATTSRVTQAPLLSQPQVAIYSRQVDAGADVFPTKWLMNGTDNSIGARWQFRYKSMNDPIITDTNLACGGSAMSNFGQETNYGDVTLGTPATYTVKNSGGTNIGCGRYFFMTISVDASQTYGYPDDIARGPTLDNLTLFYNSNPGKRLIHGKTFTEGIQQPLDTKPD